MKLLLFIILLLFTSLGFGQDKKKGEQVISKKQVIKIFDEEATVNWYEPDVVSLPNWTIKTDKNEVDIHFKIKSSFEVKKEKIQILVNEENYVGNKSGEIDIIARSGWKTITETIPIGEKANRNTIIQVGVESESGRKFLAKETLTVKYTPREINLYVVAIGPSFPNLKYTETDAKDFANLFDEKNPLFGTVEKRILAGEDAETTPIKKVFFDYKAAWDERIIKPNDVIIIFISSHGFVDRDNNFRIKATDFEANAAEITSVAYRADIVDRLAEVNCKKLVFLDACYSGAAKKKNETTIEDAKTLILETQSGVATITSSRDSQTSHEDDAWQNGAFTEALVSGLKGAADKNDDNVVTIMELYDYLKLEVPQLVKEVNPNIEQLPVMSRNDLGDFPIMVLDDTKE